MSADISINMEQPSLQYDKPPLFFYILQDHIRHWSRDSARERDVAAMKAEEDDVE